MFFCPLFFIFLRFSGAAPVSRVCLLGAEPENLRKIKKENRKTFFPNKNS
jgi:hypothetical protein